MKKNVAGQVVGVQAVNATTGAAFTGAVTAIVTGDGGAQGGGGACTHEGNGFHTYLPTQAETNYDHVAFTFTGTGAIPATVQVFTGFPQTGDSFARIGATGSGLTSLATQASVDAVDNFVDTEIGTIITDIAAVKSDTAAILADTGTDGVVLNAAGLAADAANEIADALLARNVSGGSSAGRTVKQALHFLRNKWSIGGGTLTVTDTDDVTTSWTATVSTAAGNPVSTVDPA